MIKLKMELCKARHTTPATDGAIFGNEVDPTGREIRLVCYRSNRGTDCGYQRRKGTWN